MSQTTSPIGWKEIEGGPEKDAPAAIQIVTIKFPLEIKQTDTKEVEMRVPVMRGVSYTNAEAIGKACPKLSADDHDLLIDLIEAYAQKQVLRFSITIR